MSEYRRYYIKGGTRFFTVNLRNRRSQLLTTQYQMLRHAIIKVKRDRPFEINALGRFARAYALYLDIT